MNDNWVFMDKFEHRDEAVQVLAQLKKDRHKKRYKVVRIDHNTWHEIEITNQIPPKP